MPFMVIYSTSDGASCHEQADAIDEAALFVERLRNKEGIEEIRIYRMEEISFAFRPYYKVELGMPERSGSSVPPEVVGTMPPSPSPEAPVVDGGDATIDMTVEPAQAAHQKDAVEGDASGANTHRGLFGR